MSPETVTSAEEFCRYMELTTGMPYSRQKDVIITRRNAQEIFDRHPEMTWSALAKTVDWMRARNIRVEVPYKALGYFRYAWRDGVITELNRTDNLDTDLEEEIAKALEQTSDPKWRKRLMLTQGKEARKEALEEWRESLNSSRVSAA